MNNLGHIRDLIREFLNLYEVTGDSSGSVINDSEESVGMGTRLSREEYDARKRNKIAKDAYRKWQQNNDKKIAYDNEYKRLRAAGMSNEKAERQLKSDDRFKYDYRLIARGAKIRKELDDSEANLASYVNLLNTAKKDVKIDDVKPEPRSHKFTRPILDIDTTKPMVWHMWPEAPSDDTDLSQDVPSYKPTAPGVGPGEEKLAWVFGGVVQGGSTSYDIVMPGGTKWEVKQLLTQTETIRPGTEGIRAFQEAHQELNKVLYEIKKFVDTIVRLEENSQTKVFTKYDKKRFDAIKEFIDENFVAIAHKAEIPVFRFKYFRRTLITLGELKQKYLNAEHDKYYKLPTHPVITVDDVPIKVPRSIFIDVIKYIAKESGTYTYNDILDTTPSIVSLPEILFSDLKADAFNNPTEFLNRWFDSIKPSHVFGQTQGIILVRPDSFLIIPNDQLDKVLKFTVVTQGRPRFQFSPGKENTKLSD